MQTPIKYVGSKYNLAPEIISMMPPHRTYVEVFGGSAAVLFRKPRSEYEIYNDLNDNIVTLFRVLRDPQKSALLQTMLELTPYSRSEWEAARDSIRKGNFKNDIQQAWAVFVSYNQSISGVLTLKRGGWGFGKQAKTEGYFSRRDLIPALCYRLRNVQIDCLEWQECISKYDDKDTLFYLDPPYIHETRGEPSSYIHELPTQEHIEFIEVVSKVKGCVIISGYENDIYDNGLLPIGWHKYRFDVRVSVDAKNNNHSATEILWTNNNTRQLSFLQSLDNQEV